MIPLALVLAAAAGLLWAGAKFVAALHLLDDVDGADFEAYVDGALRLVNGPRRDDLAARRRR